MERRRPDQDILAVSMIIWGVREEEACGKEMGSWFTKLRNRSLAARVSVLGAVAVALYAMISPVAFRYGDRGGLWASALAAVACLMGAEIALVVGHLLRAPDRVLWGVLFGSAARMGIPLVFGLVVCVSGGSLAEAGLPIYLLVFFPVTLAVETALSLPQTDATRQCTKAS